MGVAERATVDALTKLDERGERQLMPAELFATASLPLPSISRDSFGGERSNRSAL